MIFDQITSSLKQIHLQATMILNLVNDLLDLAKIEAFKFKLDEDYFDLTETIDQANQTMAPLLEINKLKIETQF